MKNKFLLLMSFALVLLLASCSKKEYEYITYLNTNDNCQAYVIDGKIEETYGMNNFYELSNLDDIDWDYDFTCVIVNVPNYLENPDVELLNGLYDLLYSSENCIDLIFYDTDNLDFLDDSSFYDPYAVSVETNGYTVYEYCNFVRNCIEIRWGTNELNYLFCLELFSDNVKTCLKNL